MTVHRSSLLSRLLTGALLVVGAAILAIGLGARVADLHFQTVLSGSMRPTISPGDVVVTQAVPVASLRVGDVIVFQPPNESEPVVHRIASMDGSVLSTKGDANTVPDPWHIKLAGTAAYRVIAVVPFAGWLAQLQRPALLLAGLFVGLAILDELRKEVKARSTRSQPQSQS